MNTMKREDMEIERKNILLNIGIEAAMFLHPLAKILGWVGRVAFLEHEIDKTTPKPKPQGVNNVELDLKKESVEGAEGAAPVAAGPQGV